MKELKIRTLVIGSGCAGLNAADWLALLGETDSALVTENMNSGTSRNTGSDKQTYYKLSLAGDDGDSVGDMARTLKRDDVNGDTALCEAAGSAKCFLRLAELGVPFPTNEYGEYVGYQTDHDTRRRASSVGPLTSKCMTEALERSVKSHGVRILDHLMAVRIETTCTDGMPAVTGLICLDLDNHSFIHIRCAHIIMCTGGPAQIYQNRVYPESQCGMSGMAFEAGAKGANLDCWQYGLASTGFRWNVSGSYQQAMPRYVSIGPDGTEHEFLREALGEAEAINMTFLKGYQWPYDDNKKNGSSRVDILVKAEEDKGRRVYMDYRRDPSGWSMDTLTSEARTYLINCGADCAHPIDRLRAINAPAIELYRAHGIDLETEMLEIRVCAQHHNGGIDVDANWETCVSGLYVCGEAAGTFGKTRPGGTALNSTQVGSMRAATHIARRSKLQVADFDKKTDELFLPAGDARELTAYFQKEMTRVAAFQRDRDGIIELMECGKACLENSATADENDLQLVTRIRLRDLLNTQQEVLNAMLYTLEHPTETGVLLTAGGKSFRQPARPIPERDQWFERVWKKYRELN